MEVLAFYQVDGVDIFVGEEHVASLIWLPHNGTTSNSLSEDTDHELTVWSCAELPPNIPTAI